MLAKGIMKRLSQIDTTTTKIVAMAQLPAHEANLLECLKSTLVGTEIWMSNADGLMACGTTRAEALRREDPMIAVADGLSTVEYLDLTNMFWSSTSCPAIQGNILTYKDQGHVTATYMGTLSPILSSKVNETLGIRTP